jgi:hypothetical protein
MKAICTKKTMHRGVVYVPGDVFFCESEQDKPANFRWENETAENASPPLPKRGGDCLLILGDADCMLRDVAALDVPLEREVMAINRAAFRWKAPVHYWCSVHPDMLAEWRLMWSRMGWSGGVQPHFITNRPHSGLLSPHLLANPDQGGSLTEALGAAEKLGHRKIFVAGAPLVENYSRFAAPAIRIVQKLRANGVEVHAASGALAEV